MGAGAQFLSCPDPCGRGSPSNAQSDTGQQLHPSGARCRTSRTPCQRDRPRALFLAALISDGSVGTWTFWLRTGLECARTWPRSSGSRGYVGRGLAGRGREWSVRRGAAGVVDVLMQLKFQQSWVCTGSSSTECWTFQLSTERVRTVPTVQKTVLGVDVPVINSDKVPQSRGSNPVAPDSVHPQSGGHSCCAAEYRRNSRGAVLGCLGGC